MLSPSASALFDKDHPSMAGKGAHSMLFRELKPDQLSGLRKKVGVEEWDEGIQASDGHAISKSAGA